MKSDFGCTAAFDYSSLEPPSRDPAAAAAAAAAAEPDPDVATAVETSSAASIRSRPARPANAADADGPLRPGLIVTPHDPHVAGIATRDRSRSPARRGRSRSPSVPWRLARPAAADADTNAADAAGPLRAGLIATPHDPHVAGIATRDRSRSPARRGRSRSPKPSRLDVTDAIAAPEGDGSGGGVGDGVTDGDWTHLTVSPYTAPADRSNIVSFPANCRVTVVEQRDNGWWAVVVRGVVGWAPASYLTARAEIEMPAAARSSARSTAQPASEPVASTHGGVPSMHMRVPSTHVSDAASEGIVVPGPGVRYADPDIGLVLGFGVWVYF